MRAFLSKIRYGQFVAREQLLKLVLMAGVLVLVVSAPYLPLARTANSLAIMFELIGLVQLGINGFFHELHLEYYDEVKYPYGPPSCIVRETIWHPDKSIEPTALKCGKLLKF